MDRIPVAACRLRKIVTPNIRDAALPLSFRQFTDGDSDAADGGGRDQHIDFSERYWDDNSMKYYRGGNQIVGRQTDVKEPPGSVNDQITLIAVFLPHVNVHF
jgi:hypothetical protein